ncbi:unnamed protein product [Dovyalis caffra]|uniref:Uncharacterized protein n=1 Tax=Dovyalis caffra TaxID=77055 RepID=A0AAV1RBV6_9ROSI|nr:unnamed protein product [Dovyalis caffra]
MINKREEKKGVSVNRPIKRRKRGCECQSIDRREARKKLKPNCCGDKSGVAIPGITRSLLYLAIPKSLGHAMKTLCSDKWRARYNHARKIVEDSEDA